MFQSLSIERFRGFSKLDLDDLGRVNLIVGENNTGKTSLLEAIALVADPECIKELPKLFRSFDPETDERTYEWVQRRDAHEFPTKVVATLGTQTKIFVIHRDTAKSDTARRGGPFSKFAVDYAQSQSPYEPCWKWGELTFARLKEDASLRLGIASVEHKRPVELVDSFSKLMRSREYERQLESLLASVDPRVNSPRIDVTQSRPFIAVDVGLLERIPLAQAGQGIYRLCAIFSELLGNKPQVCIIDEIENGIHYTALPVLWKGIAEVASRLDIQVFATTHSKECLEAAHEVFSDRDPYDLRVIQLDRVNKFIEGRTLDRRLIEAAIGSNIEMR